MHGALAQVVTSGRLTAVLIGVVWSAGAVTVGAGATVHVKVVVSVRWKPSVSWTVTEVVPTGPRTTPEIRPLELIDNPVGSAPALTAQVKAGMPVPETMDIWRLTTSPTSSVWLPGAVMAGAAGGG